MFPKAAPPHCRTLDGDVNSIPAPSPPTPLASSDVTEGFPSKTPAKKNSLGGLPGSFFPSLAHRELPELWWTVGFVLLTWAVWDTERAAQKDASRGGPADPCPLKLGAGMCPPGPFRGKPFPFSAGGLSWREHVPRALINHPASARKKPYTLQLVFSLRCFHPIRRLWAVQMWVCGVLAGASVTGSSGGPSSAGLRSCPLFCLI